MTSVAVVLAQRAEDGRYGAHVDKEVSGAKATADEMESADTMKTRNRMFAGPVVNPEEEIEVKV